MTMKLYKDMNTHYTISLSIK